MILPSIFLFKRKYKELCLTLQFYSLTFKDNSNCLLYHKRINIKTEMALAKGVVLKFEMSSNEKSAGRRY